MCGSHSKMGQGALVPPCVNYLSGFNDTKILFLNHQKQYLKTILYTAHFYPQSSNIGRTMNVINTKSNIYTSQKGKPSTKKSCHDNWCWEEERENAILLLNQLVKLNLAILWSPPTPEDDFVKYSIFQLFSSTSHILFSYAIFH